MHEWCICRERFVGLGAREGAEKRRRAMSSRDNYDALRGTSKVASADHFWYYCDWDWPLGIPTTEIERRSGTLTAAKIGALFQPLLECGSGCRATESFAVHANKLGLSLCMHSEIIKSESPNLSGCSDQLQLF